MVNQKEYTSIGADDKKRGIHIKILSVVVASALAFTSGYLLRSNSPQSVSMTTNLVRSSSSSSSWCINDGDCPANQEYGFCYKEIVIAYGCKTSTDCPEFQPTCEHNICVEDKDPIDGRHFGCNSDQDCGLTRFCDDHHDCKKCHHHAGSGGCGTTDRHGCNHDAGEHWCKVPHKCLGPSVDCPLL